MPYNEDIHYYMENAVLNPQPLVNGRDLEVIVSLMEMAVIELTTGPGVMFTKDQMYTLMREIIGPDTELLDVDLDIVLRNSGYLLRRHPGAQFSMR